ncbi:hypothetical protein AKN87_05800 [Thiopseudomonas alkaliphila]|uniref:DUF484 family protein n=1 Tax=Thiopseudomonas alkaliphila TaxID=1697053 RepID=UPI00069FDEFA|nr:DUF484 family protein [Thiopseudomonas alkaliphila]AKX44672.1 hypothetical protein AKN87_05800 [Thiopseudomonas alkaliphila]AKX47745.1 hypothetical protein AKN94_10570 [Thiopseudomonas alkaliphila]AKX48043.1 hypothetical protein AKN93_00390 [Thiopseudomonas alkaliphila]AKX53179.1 hypothetical protein AKN91_05455 [Thiopseudomonas alkaliphila]
MKHSMTAEQVAEYLALHPDFFQEHTELLLQLRIPHHHPGTISLVEKQLQLLRAKLAEQTKANHELMAIARDNSQLFEKTRLLTLALLEAGSLDEALSSLDEHLRHVFQVPFYSLLLFSEQPLMAGRVIQPSEARQRLGHLLNVPQPISGRLAAADLAYIFTEQPLSRVGSCAVAELYYQETKGLLAIGHPSLHYYDSQMDTLFLRYLADVLARLLSTWEIV